VRRQIDYAACYRILELPPGASIKEIEDQARFLRAAFHPDKFQGELKQLATEKIKPINVALEDLREYWKTRGEATASVRSTEPPERKPEPPPKTDHQPEPPPPRQEGSSSYSRAGWEQRRKVALRMIPYGIYVITAGDGNGGIIGDTVIWVTQTSFSPPLLVIALETKSKALDIAKSTKAFALNMLQKGQQKLAFDFFSRLNKSSPLVNGRHPSVPFYKGKTGVPILKDVPAAIECRVAGICPGGQDGFEILIGEVVEGHSNRNFRGRPDDMILRNARPWRSCILWWLNRNARASKEGRGTPVRATAVNFINYSAYGTVGE
jgi:flavin reductase (DIM6/NTAB) family NADH-FMN oxidoreductase RutF